MGTTPSTTRNTAHRAPDECATCGKDSCACWARTTLYAVVTIAAMLLATLVTATTAEAAPRATSVFVVAHQDDELTMGSSIRSHAEAGEHVTVVVATDGSATRARLTIGNRLGREVTPAEITVHRDAEFMWTCRALGATECMVAPAGLRMVDGQVTPAGADAVMDWVAATWPGAKVKSHSFLAPRHPDHRNLGEALLRANKTGVITDARFYLSWSERGDMKAAGTPIPRLQRTVRPVGDTEQNAYRLWAPGAGANRYWSVGYTSARQSMNAMRNDPASHYHAATLRY